MPIHSLIIYPAAKADLELLFYRLCESRASSRRFNKGYRTGKRMAVCSSIRPFDLCYTSRVVALGEDPSLP